MGFVSFVIFVPFVRTAVGRAGSWDLVRPFMLTCHMSRASIHVAFRQERHRVESKLDILQGTLDLMVLRTLVHAWDALHGYGIARRIEQVSGDRVILEPGDDLHLARPARAARLDSIEMGRLGEQPPREVLQHHQGGREAARGRDRELGAAGGGDGTRPGE